MIEPSQLSMFDYGLLDADTRTFVQAKAQAIHARLKRTAEDVIAIGQDLIEVRDRLARAGRGGKFHAWLRAEFDMTRQTAYRFMAVAEKFGNCNIMLQFPPTALYSLLDTPDTVIDMVETKVISATVPAIRKANEQFREPTKLAEEAYIAQPLDNEQFLARWQQDNLALGLDRWGDPIRHDEGDKEASTLEDCVGGEDLDMTIAKKPVAISYAPPAEPIWARPAVIEGTSIHPGRNIDNIPLATPHISSKNNEWYTPAKYVEAARRLMAAIDLDPASCDFANETVKATKYYDIDTNGLDKDWLGRVWLNPPYGYTSGESNQAVWSGRLIDQYQNLITTEAVLLVNAAVDTKWFQRLFAYPVCLTLGRINFSTPEPTISGSTHGSAFVYLGPQIDRFVAIFSEFGTVVKQWR